MTKRSSIKETDSNLLIFVKNPVLGRVKTRIAADTGNEKALSIYRELLKLTRNTASQVRANRFLFYSDFIDNTDDWPDIEFQKRLQSGKDLGERMKNAFAELQKNGNKCVIIGSDCAELDSELVHQAFELLNTYDAVLGPTADGGYYLLGLRKPLPAVFEDINWSTEKVLDQSIRKIEAQGMTYALLPRLRDIDHEYDWIAWQENNKE